MNFNVELSNIDYSDDKLIRALDNISENIEYKVLMSYEETEEIISAYFKEILDIDLDISNMYLDAKEGRLYYSNIFEAAIVTNQIINHFGMGSVSIGGNGELQDYYNINPLIYIRKMAKFALIEQAVEGYTLHFDQADEFTNTWIYKYLQNNKED